MLRLTHNTKCKHDWSTVNFKGQKPFCVKCGYEES